MKQPENKYLLLSRNDTTYTTYEEIPSYFHSQLIPYAKCYTDIDDKGIIIDQQIEMSGLSIYYHLIFLKEGVQLTTVPPSRYIIPACISGFTSTNNRIPLKMSLSKNSGNAFSDQHTLVTEKEFVMDFHVNLSISALKYLSDEFPAFRVINKVGVRKVQNPGNRTPFQLNEVNYQVMNRILHCKLIGKTAEVFFRRSAIDFYRTFLYYLSPEPPIMLKESHQEQLREIAAYIISHPAEADSMETLCRKFRVVPEFLSAPFEQEYYISVEELILQEKMALAFKMITETNHTLTYISTFTKHNSWEELTEEFEQYYKCNIADLRNAQ